MTKRPPIISATSSRVGARKSYLTVPGCLSGPALGKVSLSGRLVSTWKATKSRFPLRELGLDLFASKHFVNAAVEGAARGLFFALRKLEVLARLLDNLAGVGGVADVADARLGLEAQLA